MPIKVTLVSPRSRASQAKSGKSTVSVTSEFEFMNLPQLRSTRKSSLDTSSSPTSTTSSR